MEVVKLEAELNCIKNGQKPSETTKENKSIIESCHETEKSGRIQEQQKTVESRDMLAKPDKETHNMCDSG